jgi:tRNA (guanine-N7-)-methyltransferase
MLAVLDAAPEFQNGAADGGFVPRPEERPVSRFERRGLKLGHAVYDLLFHRR